MRNWSIARSSLRPIALTLAAAASVAAAQPADSADTTPPTLTITRRPPAAAMGTSATIEFFATDFGSGLDYAVCQIDSGALDAACQNPIELPSVSVGPHTVQITVFDRAGNSATELLQWRVLGAGLPSPKLGYLGVTSAGLTAQDHQVDAVLGPIGRPRVHWTTNRSDLAYDIRIQTPDGRTVCRVRDAATLVSNGQTAYSFDWNCILDRRDRTYRVRIAGMTPEGARATARGKFSVGAAAARLPLGRVVERPGFVLRVADRGMR